MQLIIDVVLQGDGARNLRKRFESRGVGIVGVQYRPFNVFNVLRI